VQEKNHRRERRPARGLQLAAIAIVIAASVGLAGCGVKGDPVLPEGVKDTKPFPRTYPQTAWPTKTTPLKPSVKPGEGPGATPGAPTKP
jgi:hypothetical protein